MNAIKFSVNKKLNGVLNEILDDLLSIHDTEEESRADVIRYCNEFRSKSDYNIVMYGNMIIAYSDVRAFYKRHGYKSMERWSDSRIWETYKRQVGWVARQIFRGKA